HAHARRLRADDEIVVEVEEAQRGGVCGFGGHGDRVGFCRAHRRAQSRRTAGRPVRLRTLRYGPLPYRPLDPTEPPRRTGRVLRAALLVLLASCGAGGAAVRAPRGPQEARIASDRAARVFVLEPGGHMVEAGSLRP